MTIWFRSSSNDDASNDDDADEECDADNQDLRRENVSGCTEDQFNWPSTKHMSETEKPRQSTLISI